MKPLRYVIFVPKCVPKRGKPWLAVDYGRALRKDAMKAFCPDATEWPRWKKDGWSIVRVEVTA